MCPGLDYPIALCHFWHYAYSGRGSSLSVLELGNYLLAE